MFTLKSVILIERIMVQNIYTDSDSYFESEYETYDNIEINMHVQFYYSC